MAPVHEAAERNDVEELGRLLDEDPRLIRAEHLLYSAIKTGGLDAARLLIARGADVDERAACGLTPVMRACLFGCVEMVSLFLDGSADHSLRNDADETVFMAALVGKQHDRRLGAVLLLLLKDGRVPVDVRDREGRTPLWWACLCGHTDGVRVLLIEGLADHMIADSRGETPMAVARREGKEECIRLLQWYEGELKKAYLLSRARALVDATESITKAAEKVKVETQAEAQRSREEAAPVYLSGRVGRGEVLPVVEVVGQGGQHDDGKGEMQGEGVRMAGAEALPVVEVVGQEGHGHEDERAEREREAVCEFALRGLAGDLYVEMMEGVRQRRWVPGEVEGGRQGDAVGS